MSEPKFNYANLIFPFIPANQLIPLARLNSKFKKALQNLAKLKKDLKFKGLLSSLPNFIKVTEVSHLTVMPQVEDSFVDMETTELIKSSGTTFDLIVPSYYPQEQIFILLQLSRVCSLECNGLTQENLIALLSKFKSTTTSFKISVDFKITTALTELIADCPNLSKIHIKTNNSPRADSLQKIYAMANLKELYLDIPNLSQVMLIGISQNQALEVLKLEKCDVQSLEIVKNIPNLKQLTLNQHQSSQEYLQSVTSIKSIKKFYFYGMNMSNIQLNFAEESKIDCLDLGNFSFSGTSIKKLKNINSLEKLLFYGNNIDNACIKEILTIVSLRKLSFYSCFLSFNTNLLTQFKFLRSLNLSKVPRTSIKFEMFVDLNLEKLYMYPCGLINIDIEMICKQKNLAELHIGNNTLSLSLQYLKLLGKLKSLDVSGSDLRNKHVIESIEKIASLRVLTIDNCKSDFETLTQAVMKLKELRILSALNANFSRAQMKSLLVTTRIIELNTNLSTSTCPELNLWNQLRKHTKLRINSNLQPKNTDIEFAKYLLNN